MKETIKGQCENCGEAYKREVELEGRVFPTVICEACGKETQNFDSASLFEDDPQKEVDRENARAIGIML